MTRAMIKKSYFADDDYQVKGPPHKYDRSGNPKNPADPLVQFNLPPSNLKAIVDGITQDDTLLKFTYPVNDMQLQVEIIEKFQGQEIHTRALFDTYELSQNVKDDYSVTANNNVGSVYAKLAFFK